MFGEARSIDVLIVKTRTHTHTHTNECRFILIVMFVILLHSNVRVNTDRDIHRGHSLGTVTVCLHTQLLHAADEGLNFTHGTHYSFEWKDILIKERIFSFQPVSRINETNF